MQKSLLLLIMLTILGGATGFGQMRQTPWTVGASFNGLSYKNVQDKKYFQFDGMTGAPSVFVGRYLNHSFDVRLEYTYAKVFYPNDLGYPNVDGLYTGMDLHDAGLMLHFKFNNGYMFKEGWFSPYVFSGVGGNNVDEDFNFYVPVGAGINIHITPNLTYHIRVAYKVGVDNTYDYTQYGTGLNFNFGKPVKDQVKDDDNDGVENALDKCPKQIGLVELMGCPDSDGDGIADPDDKCPTEVGPEDNQGCPWPDSDGDKVPDHKDKCPFTAGLPATMGCPDTDGDGVIDGEDNCPKQFGPSSNKGCPLPDTDGDGVPDDQDACPKEKGTLANDGCPGGDDGVVKMAFDNLEFEEGSAKIKESSFESLDRLADMMKKNKSYKLRIEGHTDNQGDPAANVNLSQNRARAVRDYLIREHGIDPTRFQVIGYGDTKPIADNSTEEGRAENRRVELKFYE